MRLRLFAIPLLFTCAAFAQTTPITVPSAAATTVAQQPPPDHYPNTTVGIDAAGAARTLVNPTKSVAYRQSATGSVVESVDEKENRTLLVRDLADRPIAAYHRFKALPDWYERHIYDANGQLVMSSVNLGTDMLNTHSAYFGISPAFPDWVRIDFAGARTLKQVRLYSVQDNYQSPVEPLSNPAMSFKNYGVTDYELQYWNGTKWVTPPGGFVAGNAKIQSIVDITPNITASAIRVVVHHALGTWSRIAELEVIDSAGANVARAAGSVATASTSYDTGFFAPSAINDGDRMSRWWNDATAGNTPAGTTVTTQNSYDGSFTTTTIRNSFVTVMKTHQNKPIPNYVQRGYQFQIDRERIDMLGKSFDVGIYKTFNGIEMWDNQGGARVYRYDWANRVKFIADELGDIVAIVRDDSGRPTGVYLGDNTYIEYKYDAKGLLTKRFVNRSTGKIFYQVDRSQVAAQNKFPTAREVTTAFLPGHGPVAEWDRKFGQWNGPGYILASLQGQPYALIPMQAVTPSYNNNMPVRRMFSLFHETGDPLLTERVEYDEDRIIVHLRTGAEGAFSSEHVSTISVPRWGTWADTPASTARFSQGTLDDSNAPDNDDGGTAGSFSGEITVTATRPNLPPIFFFFPWPGDSGSRPGGQVEAPPPNTLPSPPDPNAVTQQYPSCPAATGESLSKFERSVAHAKTLIQRNQKCVNLFRTLTGGSGTTLNRKDVTQKLSSLTLQDGTNCRLGTNDGCTAGVPMWVETGSASNAVVACPQAWGAAFETMDMAGPNARPGQGALYVLHEVLHLLGLPSHDTAGAQSADAINQMICRECGPFESGVLDPIDCN